MSVLFTASTFVALISVLAAYRSAFTVPTGYVGIQYLFGSLQPAIYAPGLHITSPLHRTAWVEIRPQTDVVEDVLCGTKDGLGLRFERIEIGNTLPKEHVLAVVSKFGEDYDTYLVRDKIRHQMAVICGTMTLQQVFIDEFDAIDDRLLEFLRQSNKELQSNLIIDFVRLSKPVLPSHMRASYEKLAEEKIARAVEHETQGKLLKQAETKAAVAAREAELELLKVQKLLERQAAEHEASITRTLAEARAEQERQMIIAKAEAERQSLAADLLIRQARARSEADTLLASGVSALHAIDGYTGLEAARILAAALANNTKFFFGEPAALPNMLPMNVFASGEAGKARA